MAKAYSYARFSSGSQAEGDSLRRQLSAARSYANNHDLDLDTSLQDHGVSGYDGANRTKGALKTFLDMIEDGRIEVGSYLLLDSMDRLSRLPVARASHQLLGIALAGVKVVTLNNERVFDENADLASMILAVAEIERSHQESREKGRKVAEAHKAAKGRARASGAHWHSSGPGWLRPVRVDKDTVRFEPIEDRVSTVREIFRLALDDGYGSRVIADILNERKIKPFSRHYKEVSNYKPAAIWSEGTVRKILTSRAVLGEYQPRFRDGSPDGEPAVGAYGEPIIDRADYDRLQARFAASQPRGRRNGPTQFNNLLQGVCVCEVCGGQVGVHIRSKDKVALYHCNRGGLRGCQNRTRYRVSAVEAAILNNVEEFELGGRPEINEDMTKLQAAQAERAGLLERIKRLLTRLEDGDEFISALYQERRNELKAINHRIDVLKRSVEQAVHDFGPDRHLANIAALLRETGKDGVELYRSRTRLSHALKAVITSVTFHAKHGFSVRVLNGARDYYFDRDGEHKMNFCFIRRDRPLPEQYHQNDPDRLRVLKAMRGEASLP